ncbi:hypothetical protein BH10PSE12_BH10PSE12_24720 [soil metagenome]
MRLAFLPLILMMVSSPAFSQGQAVEAWQMDADALRVTAADIALPQVAGGLSLVKSGEISDGGEGLDNYAQFASDDGVVQATAYIYMPGFADAAIAAYITDKAILERFGASTRRTAYRVAAAAGHDGTAIRSSYEGADGTLTTAAALVHAGNWIVKLRVTAPTERAADVEKGIDAMLAGLRLGKDVAPHAAVAANVAACPANDRQEAIVLKAAVADKAPAATALGSFPRDGLDALCVRNTVQIGDSSYDVLQAADGRDSAAAIIIPLDDAGKIMRFDRLASGAGYQMTVNQVGRTDVYNAYDRIPTVKQIAGIIDGDAKGAMMLSSTAHGADGRRTTVRNDRQLP